MKRTIPVICALLICAVTSAYEVSSSRAREVAARFFGVPVSSSSVELVNASSSTKSGDSSSPEYYIFNRDGGGFVIISGDDSLRPVLGYSDSGTFSEKIPENVAWWLDVMAESVRFNRDSGIVPVTETLAEWDMVGRSATKASGTKCLNTVEWNQYEPFYNKCPVFDSKQTIAGCVPVALCEIMAYYKWPDKAVGTIPDYTDGNKRTISGYDYFATYDWENISGLNEAAAKKASAAIKENIGQLLVDVGYTVQATYGSGATSANTLMVLDRLCGPFRFNKAARLENRTLYEDADWLQMVVEEIDAGRPILYHGDNDRGGHAFVIDGYDDSGNVHINFGWGGSKNGYYWIGQNYYKGQGGFFDFYPDEDGTSKFPAGFLMLTSYLLDDEYYNFKPSGTIQKGSSFSMKMGGLSSNYKGVTKGNAKLVMVGKDGTVKDNNVSGTFSINLPRTNYYTGYTVNSCKVHSDISFGDRIEIWYCPDGSSDWSCVQTQKHGESVSCYPLTPYTFIDVSGTYSVGESVNLRLKNNNFPYTWGFGNNSDDALVTEWRFFCNGELYESITDYSARFFTFPKAGSWMVQAIVRKRGHSEIYTSLSAQADVK